MVNVFIRHLFSISALHPGKALRILKTHQFQMIHFQEAPPARKREDEELGSCLQSPPSGGLVVRVQDVMKKKVETVTTETPAEEAWNRMRMRRIHHLVVTRGAEVVGVLSDRDMGGPGNPGYREGRSAGDLMTPSVVIAKKDTTLREAANLMRGRTIGSLPVIDDKKLVGIVTTTDLLTLIGKGSERPVAKSKRWIMKGRGARRKSGPPR
jgi:acetoin utilization protein AcuB